MCNDGNKLCGRAMINGTLHDASTKSPNQPPTWGRWKTSVSGSSRKKAPATRMEKTTRRAKVPSSRSSRHRKGAAAKKKSIDMYGTIISGTKGIASSQVKYHVLTSVRWSVIQFVL